MRLPLPPQRPSLGPLKPHSSAVTTQATLPNGQLELTIQHEHLRGLTPRMLRWWFENIGGTFEYEGAVYSRYLLWHPRDHIHWELARPAPNGAAGQGAYFRIVEAFAADPRNQVDSVEFVERLDETGISLVKRVLGVEIFRLEHFFGSAADGATYFSRMLVGPASGPLAGVFNRLIRPRIFPDDKGTAWLTHNIEEVGLLEHLIPRLYPAPPPDLG